MGVTPLAPEQRGGTVVLALGDRQELVIEALTGGKIAFDVRQTGIRLSPHIYTEGSEIDAIIEILNG